MNDEARQRIEERRDGLRNWLREEGGVCLDQAHLESGTDERAYWHHGYCSALNDVLSLLNNKSTPLH